MRKRPDFISAAMEALALSQCASFFSLGLMQEHSSPTEKMRQARVLMAGRVRLADVFIIVFHLAEGAAGPSRNPVLARGHDLVGIAARHQQVAGVVEAIVEDLVLARAEITGFHGPD